MNRALGIAGAGSQITELEDALLQQVVNAGDVARRSIPPGTGLFWSIMRTVHGAGATARSLEIEPHNPVTPAGASVAIAPYPDSVVGRRGVPDQFDLFLLGAQLQLSTSGAAFTEATLKYNNPLAVHGWALEDDEGVFAAIAPTSSVLLVNWDDAQGTTTGAFAVARDLRIWTPIGHRMRRGQTIIFDSDASAAITMNCACLWALMPICFGQNVQV